MRDHPSSRADMNARNNPFVAHFPPLFRMWPTPSGVWQADSSLPRMYSLARANRLSFFNQYLLAQPDYAWNCNYHCVTVRTATWKCVCEYGATRKDAQHPHKPAPPHCIHPGVNRVQRARRQVLGMCACALHNCQNILIHFNDHRTTGEDEQLRTAVHRQAGV